MFGVPFDSFFHRDGETVLSLVNSEAIINGNLSCRIGQFDKNFLIV